MNKKTCTQSQRSSLKNYKGLSKIRFQDKELKGFISSHLGVMTKKKDRDGKKGKYLITEPEFNKKNRNIFNRGTSLASLKRGRINDKMKETLSYSNLSSRAMQNSLLNKNGKPDSIRPKGETKVNFKEENLKEIKRETKAKKQRSKKKKPNFFKRLTKKEKLALMKKKPRKKDPRVTKLLSMIARSHLPRPKPDEIEQLFMSSDQDNPFQIQKNALKDSVALFKLSVEANKDNIRLSDIDVFKVKKGTNYFMNTEEPANGDGEKSGFFQIMNPGQNGPRHSINPTEITEFGNIPQAARKV